MLLDWDCLETNSPEDLEAKTGTVEHAVQATVETSGANHVDVRQGDTCVSLS